MDKVADNRPGATKLESSTHAPDLLEHVEALIHFAGVLWIVLGRELDGESHDRGFGAIFHVCVGVEEDLVVTDKFVE